MVWLALVLGVAAAAGGLAFAIVRGVRLWRTFRSFMGASGRALDELGRTLEALATHEPADFDRATASFERLRRSRAQLNVLTNAVARVRGQASGALALYPRK